LKLWKRRTVGIRLQRESLSLMICMDLRDAGNGRFEATRQIRMSPDLKEVVVIATSASVLILISRREAGCNGFVPSQSGKRSYNSYVFT